MLKIAIYRGEGASALSLRQLVKAFRRLAPEMEVIRLSKEDIASGNWQGIELLVFPGGRDLFYHESLSGEPVERLREWVFQGGRYWGICAGGYFGSSRVCLGIGEGNKITSQRQMRLYPGSALGPSLGNVEYDYLSQKECEVTPILLSEELGGESLLAYYNTGCSFVLDEKNEIETRELGWYGDVRAKDNSCCLVESFPGKGYALLCGVHPEFHSDYMPNDPDFHTQRVVAELKNGKEKIDELFKRLLSRVLKATR